MTGFLSYSGNPPARWVPVLVLLSLLAAPAGILLAQGQDAGSLVGLDGAEAGGALLEGDVIAIVFASWSPRCRDVVARANRLHQSWGGRARVLLIDFQEGESEVRRFLEGKDAKVRVLLDRDGSFSKRHGVTTLPTLLVLQGGSVAFKGRLPADADPILRPILD